MPPPSDAQDNAPVGVAQIQDAGEHTNAQGIIVKPSNIPKVLLQQSGGMFRERGTWTATLLPSKNDSGTLSKNFSSESPSSLRSSKRNASNVDMDSTEKAARLKAQQNLETQTKKGNLQQPLSFNSRDDSSILNAAMSLGVVLGNNEQSVLNSLKRLKDIEHNRLLEDALLRDENCGLAEDASTVYSNDDNVDLDALNLICSDIAEGLGDGGCDPLILQTPLSQSVGGRSSGKKNIKKTNK